MSTRALVSSLVVLSAMSLARCAPPGAEQGTTGSNGGGGAFTTFDRTRGGCLDSPNGINCNHYTSADRVYLTGGPSTAGLSDGVYFFAVLAPGTQNDGFVDGAVGNLSDPHGGTGYTAGDEGSGDAVSNRTFTVIGHEITSYTGTHPRGVNPAGRAVIGLSPFDLTPSPGGVYILAICRVGATSPSDCAYDAFHIDLPDTSDGGGADAADVSADDGSAAGDVTAQDVTSTVDASTPDATTQDAATDGALDDRPAGDVGGDARDGDSTDVALPDGCNASSITSNFNGTPIAAGSWIWFNSVGTLRGATGGATVRITRQAIDFAAGGVLQHVTVSDAQIVVDPRATSATTAFDATSGAWQTVVPAGYSGNVFLSGAALHVGPGGLPGGINPVTWTGAFTSTSDGVSIAWQWSAAVYTTLSDNLDALHVKPVDDNALSVYRNAHHAGTPEAFLDFVTGGARGGGGSNFTGSLSATRSSGACVLR